MLRPVFIFIFLLAFAGARAQKDSSLIEMDQLGKDDFSTLDIKPEDRISSASRSQKDVNDIPFTAYVVTSETIDKRGYVTLVDILKDLPGTKTSQPGSAQHGETFMLRGLFGNYYTKILLDNVPLQPTATLGMPLGAQIPIEAIERVEVIYGPAADVFGADAMAGVINIVTKKSDKIKWGNARVFAGSPLTTGGSFNLGGKFGRKGKVYNYSMYCGFHQMRTKNIVNGHEEVYDPLFYSGGDSSFISNEHYSGTLNMPNINGLPSLGLFAGINVSGKKLQVGFDYLYRKEQSAIGLNPLFVTYHNPNHTFGERIFRGYGIYSTTLNNWRSRTYLSWLSYRMDAASSYSTILNPVGVSGEFFSYSASDDVYFEQNMQYSWLNGLTFQTAFTWQYSGNFPYFGYLSTPFNPRDYRPFQETLESDQAAPLENIGFSPLNFYNTSLMGQLYYSTQKWEGLFGIRADYNSLFGGSINPRLGMGYSASDRLKFRISAGSAFRPPTSYLIFNSYQVNQTSIPLPAPQWELNPERLISAEAGVRFIRNEHCKIDFAVFYHNRNNHLVRRSVRNGSDYFYGYLNSDDANSNLFGVQVQHVIRDLGSLRFFNDISIQYTRGREELPLDAGTLNHYREQPDWTIKWIIGLYPVKNLHLGLRNHFMSNWILAMTVVEELQDVATVDGFYNLDLFLNYEINRNMEFSLNLYNITNASYAGITASGGLGEIYNVNPNESQFLIESLTYNPQYGFRFLLGLKAKF